MSPAERYVLGAFIFGVVTSAFFIIAGGLGLASSVWVLAVLLIPVAMRAAAENIIRNPLVIIVAGLTLAWFIVSWFWSPYVKPDQAIKLAIATPLYAFLPFAAGLLDASMRARVAPWFAGAALVCAAWMAFEALSGAWVSTLYQTHVHGIGNFEDAQAFGMRRMSRGASAFILLSGPAALWLWLRGGLKSRAAASALMVAAVLASACFRVEANVLALALGLAAAAMAIRAPVAVLQAILTGAAVLLAAAPLIMGATVSLFPDELAHSLPMSWHWRLEIWVFALEQIRAAPLFGHGLDATRAISDVVVLRGVEIERMPQHAHNVLLQIWLETGAVGALLAASVLAAAAHAAGSAGFTREQAAGLAFASVFWLTSVMVGYGVWQEWHHGALAFACAAAMLNRSGVETARVLRFFR